MGNKVLVTKVEGGTFQRKAKKGDRICGKDGVLYTAEEDDLIYDDKGNKVLDFDERTGELKSWARMDVWQMHREQAFQKGIIPQLAVESWALLEPLVGLVPFIAEVSEESGRTFKDANGKPRTGSMVYEIKVIRANIPLSDFLMLEKDNKSPDTKPPKSPPPVPSLS
ncbi:MAG: hypothetical protein PHS30_05560 [Bacteroidales bacterium]|nr:hypothetical protein [Bacteroidales bacterium]